MGENTSENQSQEEKIEEYELLPTTDVKEGKPSKKEESPPQTVIKRPVEPEEEERWPRGR